ncbi:MAG: methyltransferase, partial [Myxococcales bacterium]|nr:methyltransferase [Myxococcales bacterium]
MKTAWDYTTLADAYLSRPDYSDSAIDELVALA